jgi:hypothetical protein
LQHGLDEVEGVAEFLPIRTPLGGQQHCALAFFDTFNALQISAKDLDELASARVAKLMLAAITTASRLLRTTRLSSTILYVCWARCTTLCPSDSCSHRSEMRANASRSCACVVPLPVRWLLAIAEAR